MFVIINLEMSFGTINRQSLLDHVFADAPELGEERHHVLVPAPLVVAELAARRGQAAPAGQLPIGELSSLL